MTRTTNLHLALSRALPNTGRLADMDLDPDVVALRITTELPGGFATCEIGIDTPARRQHYAGAWRGYLPVQLDIRPFAHVVIRAGQATLFEGRIMRLTRGPDGRYRGFMAIGYGITAMLDDFFLTAGVEVATTGVILKKVLARAAPLIRVDGGAITDPQVNHLFEDYDQQAPGEIVDQIGKEGGVTKAPLDWVVYEDRRAELRYRTPPPVADYRTNWGDHITDWDEDYIEVYGTATVAFQTAAGADSGTLARTQPDFYPRYEINRARLLQGDTMSADGADQFRDTWLEQHLEPEIQAALEVDGLRTPSGIEIPAHLIRAGQWIQVGADGPLLPIVATDYDGLSRRAALELGARVITRPENVMRRHEEVRQRHARKTNLLTGTRWRR